MLLCGPTASRFPSHEVNVLYGNEFGEIQKLPRTRYPRRDEEKLRNRISLMKCDVLLGLELGLALMAQPRWSPVGTMPLVG